MAGSLTTSHDLSQCWPRSLPNHCITLGQWVNCLTRSLQPMVEPCALGQHCMAQVMAWYLTTPSHYLHHGYIYILFIWYWHESNNIGDKIEILLILLTPLPGVSELILSENMFWHLSDIGIDSDRMCRAEHSGYRDHPGLFLDWWSQMRGGLSRIK